MTRVNRVAGIGFLLAMAHSAEAWTTSLNLIPIAQVLAHREVALDYSITGLQRSYSHVGGVQIGLGDRFEVGIDHDFLGTATFNAKAQLYNQKGTALSVGITDSNGRNGNFFAVASHELPSLTLHGGTWRMDGQTRAILGVEIEAFRIATLMFEHISGSGGATWAGFSVDVPKSNGLTLGIGVGIPNRPSDGVQHILYATYTFRF